MYTFKLNSLKGQSFHFYIFQAVAIPPDHIGVCKYWNRYFRFHCFSCYFLNFCLQKRSMSSLPYNPWNWNIPRTFNMCI